ncbi:hypothetical protein HYT17_01035 [Candidatus Microgenomates bacterium]|nr:hypothetical protein [Candidatus Microgenomates bacterium]
MVISEQARPLTLAQEAAFVGLFERLPLEAIGDVIVNGRMRQRISDPRLLFWFNTDNLVRLATVFAIGSQLGLPRLQAPTMHRAATLKYTPTKPFVDEHGRCFGQIVVKGNGLTNRSLTSSDFSTKRLGSRAPLGLFGLKDAQTDMEIADKLAMYGARVSRGIAILIVDHDELRKWWYRNLRQEGFEYDLEEALDIIEGNGDQAVLYVRAIGADRLADYSLASKYPQLRTQAAQVILAEAQLFGVERFLNFYGLDKLNIAGININRLMNDLSDLAAWDKKSDRNQPPILSMALRFFQVYFHNWNFGVRKIFSEREFNRRFGLKAIPPQNFCLNGSWCDFEPDGNGIYPDSANQKEDFSPFYQTYPGMPDRDESSFGGFAKKKGQNKAKQRLGFY